MIWSQHQIHLPQKLTLYISSTSLVLHFHLNLYCIQQDEMEVCKYNIVKPWCCWLLGLLFLFASTASSFPVAETHYHEFVVCACLSYLQQLSAHFSYSHVLYVPTGAQVEATPVKRLCKTQNTITVNGQFPGPTLQVRNGDHLVIKVVNRARYNVTLHWYA